MPDLRIGLVTPIPPRHPKLGVDTVVLAQEAEQLGFESFWAQEHSVAPVNVVSESRVFKKGQVPGFNDPLVMLARVSAVTTRIKLGTATLLPAERNPLALAKQIATLDLYSEGRVLVGVGAGWLREQAEIFGVDFDHRWAQVKECCLAMKKAWVNEVAEFHGQYYDYPPVRVLPHPSAKPHPPILLGGTAPNVLNRVASWADGWVPHWVTLDQVHEARKVLDEISSHNRRPRPSISVYSDEHDLETVTKLHEAGSYRVLIRPPTPRDEAEALNDIRALADELL